MKFCGGGMLEATRVKMSDSEKRVNKNTSDIPFTKRVTRKFLVTVVQNNGKEMYKKRVLHVQSHAFLLIRPIVVVFFFTVLVAFAA